MKSKICAKVQAPQKIVAHIFTVTMMDNIKLLGTVASEEEREWAALFVAALEPGKRLVNSLDVDPRLAREYALTLIETPVEQVDLSADVSGPDETDSPYFPATDPVITMTNGDLEILGGFAPTSMDDQTVAVSVDGQVGYAKPVWGK